jgi:hypothetical protein
MIVNLALAALVSTADHAPSDEAVCYDRAIVGYLVKAEHEADLQDLMPRSKTELYIGERWDVTIRVQRSLAGAPHEGTIRARVILTHLIKPSAPLLLLLRNGPLWVGGEDVVMSSQDGRSNVPAATPDYPWRVVYVESWRGHGRFEPGDAAYPPRCEQAAAGSVSLR